MIALLAAANIVLCLIVSVMVGVLRDRQADGHIEERERHPGHERNARIRETQIQPDRLEDRRHDKAVGDVESAAQPENVPEIDDDQGKGYDGLNASPVPCSAFAVPFLK